MGFQIVSNILKTKNPANWLAKYIFDYQFREEVLEKYCWQSHKGNYGASFNTPQKAHIDRSIFFFKIRIAHLYCWFILAHFWPSLTKSTTLSRDIGNILFQSTMGMPAMPDHTQEKFYDQTTASMDILLHGKSKISTSNSFRGIKI